MPKYVKIVKIYCNYGVCVVQWRQLKKGTARAVKVKDMFRAFILTLVEAFENKEDTYGYTYWDIVRGIRMANERHAITDGEVDSLCYKMNCTREEMLTA